MARSLILFTLCLFSCPAIGQQAVNLNQQGKQDFLADFPSGGRLDLNIRSGEVTIRGSDDSKVKVTLEPLLGEPARPFAEVIGEIRRRQARRGFEARTRDEVDRFIISERESWGD